ncbi:cellulose synthase subunit BcsC-related outer membrane protein [Hyphomonas oceanitis]|uniref:cellulose synthase subunit BcsC-related outer membrane protein n=1 Tax=Hyphomonas oceanitis TaxID=81033 RepID=UPI003002A9A0
MLLRRLLRAAAVGALIAPSFGGVMTAAADPALAGKAEGVIAIGIPTADEPAQQQEAQAAATQLVEIGPAPADVQAVWDLGAANQWNSAEDRLAGLKAANPGWQPPRDLIAYVANGALDQRIADAVAEHDWTTVLSALPPVAADKCETPFRLFARADALEGLGEPAAINAYYVRALTVCDAPDSVATLAARAASVLDQDGLAALRALAPLQQRASDNAQIGAAYAKIVQADNRLQFNTAINTGHIGAAVALADTSGDPDLLMQAGWAMLETDPSGAGQRFSRSLAESGPEDARRGLVLASLASGDISAARAAVSTAPDPASLAELSGRIELADARVHREQGSWREAVTLANSAVSFFPALAVDAGTIAGGALLDAAGAATEAGNYTKARALALEAADYAPTRRAGRMRAAWSDLRLGNDAAAASLFSQLYVESPEAESAEGYALAAQRTGGMDTAAALARTVGGPLGARLTALNASAAFDQGDYLTAKALAPDSFPPLEGIDSNWYRQAVAVRSQGGTSGQNRLSGVVSTTSAGLIRGRNRYEAGVSVYSLDPGRSALPVIDASRETVAMPYLAWAREGDTSIAARVGVTPLNADVDPALVGEIAIAHEDAGRAVEARAFARPKMDSVLSFAGQRDATTGEAFGRVIESGVALRGRLPVGKSNTLQADIEATSLHGENTADNSKLALGVAANRNFARKGFAYLVSGLFYQFQSYDENTNFFTPGHGGYFSPQTFHRTGVSLNAQTNPMKHWILKADAAVAYESVSEDPVRANPLLRGTQPLIGGSDSSGLAGALDLSAARRIAPEIILSGNLSAIQSEAYEDVRVGLALTWVPGGRDGLVRNDLPQDPFNPTAWTQP